MTDTDMNGKPLIFIISMMLLCSSCADAPPAPPPALPPTQVSVEISSDGTVNPDINGAASPVLLRIYELKEKSNFVNANFFALFDKEQATLAGDLVRKQEFQIVPNAKKTVAITVDPSTRLLGFFAAFRSLDNAQWRAVSNLQEHKNNILKLKLNGANLTVLDETP